MPQLDSGSPRVLHLWSVHTGRRVAFILRELDGDVGDLDDDAVLADDLATADLSRFLPAKDHRRIGVCCHRAIVVDRRR